MIAIALDRFGTLYVRFVVFGVVIIIFENSQNTIHIRAGDERRCFPVMNQPVWTLDLFSRVKRLPLFNSRCTSPNGIFRSQPFLFGEAVDTKKWSAAFQLCF